MSVEREMSLAEWCAKLPSQHLVNQELSTLNTQLAALAYQNAKMREALTSTLDMVARGVPDLETVVTSRKTLSFPDLAAIDAAMQEDKP